jgi:hypothetical protein
MSDESPASLAGVRREVRELIGAFCERLAFTREHENVVRLHLLEVAP